MQYQAAEGMMSDISVCCMDVLAWQSTALTCCKVKI